MKYAGPQWPLFNRVAVFIIGSGLLIGTVLALGAVFLGRTKPGNEPEIVPVLLLILFGAMGGLAIWLSVMWRNRTVKELEAFPSFDALSFPDDAIICRFSTGLKDASLVVDSAAAAVHFENCHVPREFLATTTCFSCPISEVMGFFFVGSSVVIVTATGKAQIPSFATNYAQLCKFLAKSVPEDPPGFSSEHPMMAFVYLAGALLGLFGGLLVAPRNANNNTLGLFILLGAIFGVLGGRFVVFLGDRCLRTNLARPIGCGVGGAVCGWLVTRAMGPAIGWNATPMVALVLAGAIIGVMIGRKRPHAPSSE